MILPDDNYSVRGARERFDPKEWISGIGDSPDDVAHALELACLRGIDEVAERTLAGVAVGPRYPVRASNSPLLRWALPRSFRRPRAVTVLDVRFSTHISLVLGLAARGDGPAPRRIRVGLQELHLPQRAPWWLNDSLERFTNLTQFTAPGTPWHVQATFPTRFLCLPRMCELSLDGAGLGDHRLATAQWCLPSLTRLSLSGNGLTRVPDAVLGLDTLEVLHLQDNPIREVPSVLCDGLPGLRYVDLRRTGVTTLPKCFKARPGLHVQIGG